MLKRVQLIAIAGFSALSGLLGLLVATRAHLDVAFVPGAIAVQPTATPVDLERLTPEALATRWVVSAAEAVELSRRGAIVLDARNRSLGTPQLPGAIAVRWQDFSQPEAPNRGQLLADDAELARRLRAIGVSNRRPVVVFGAPQTGWGEEGRIVWMLRTLGHTQAVLVDGGYNALQGVGWSALPAPAEPGDFVVQRTETWSIQRDSLRRQLEASRSAGGDRPLQVLLDTRDPAEFAGAILYGETRGGHIPGAIHLHYKRLLDDQGRLLPPAELLQVLQAAGVPPNAEIVAYCTGGIRSGWMTAMLSDLGLSARNYAGSIWEWSAAPAAEYPLE